MSHPTHEPTDLEAEEDYEILTQPTSPSSSFSSSFSSSSTSSSTLETKTDSSSPLLSNAPSPSPWHDRTSTFTSLANQYGTMQSRMIKFGDGRVERRWFWVLDTHRGKPHPPTTLLLIHGIGGRVEHFVDQIVDVMNRVDEGSLRVVAMDLMGHGRSPKPRGSHHYHSDEFVADLEHIMSTSTSKHHLVMGHSLGAALAATLAVRSRFPISRLILLGIPDLINKKKTLSLGARIFQLMMRNCWERVLIALRPLISKAVIAAAYHPTTSRDLIVAEATCNSQNPFYVVRSVAEGAKLHDVTATSFTRISCPTLLLHGATDGVCSPDASRTLAQYITHATLQIIPNTSHNVSGNVMS